MDRRDFLKLISVTDYGAKGDGKHNNRASIQQAIDACAAAGGGALRIPPGRYLSGALRLKSRVALWLDHGAVLVASGNPADYEQRRLTATTPRDNWGSAFLLAENAEGVRIGGSGVITGAGLAKPRVAGQPLEPFRPRLISFERCRDISVEGVTLRDSDRWTLHFYDCDHVRARGLRIHAAYNIVNTDGIDIDGSRNVIVADCDISAGDDCIVLKTTNYLGPARPLENVSVSSCVLSTRANGFKIGTETHGDISNISFSNSVVYGEGDVRPNSAVSLEMVDGARLRGVAVSNISARRVKAGVFLRLGDRSHLAPTAPPGSLANVVISNIVAEDTTIASSITGVPASAIENVTLSGFRVSVEGGGTAEMATREVPERESAYPDATMFGQLPAYGLYLRHARGVTLRDIDLNCRQPDARPAMVTEDVTGLRVDGR